MGSHKYSTMDSLKPNIHQGRRRALSINSIDPDHQHAMNDSLDNLQSDLSLIRSQWNKVLTENSNPLELALAFLDDTSVGLSHRYQEFNQLKERIGSHLRTVVGEHSQAFNSNVASYSKTVSALTDAQENTIHIRQNLSTANKMITTQKGSLEQLNNESLHLTNTIASLSYIEELLQIPERIEENMRKEDFKEVQKLLERGFILSNTTSLKNLKQLKPIHQQLEFQEHTLFQNMIEEIHSIVYSKNGINSLDTNLLETVSISRNGFTSLENYLYNIVNIDIMKQSIDLNTKLEDFIKNVRTPGFYQTVATVNSDNNTDYVQLFALLSLIKDINKLPVALNVLIDRSKVEIHNIVMTSTENVRAKHPTFLKMVSSMLSNGHSFGLSVKSPLSLIMRECFWEIFVKYLLVIQKHRAIYEIVNTLQSSSSSSTNKNYYRFDIIWNILLQEVEQLISRYIYNPLLLVKEDKHRLNNDAPILPKRKNQKLFSLQNNIDDDLKTREHVGDLRTLLKDLFVGFSVPSDLTTESIYIENISFDEEKALISPSVFNMKVLLEPFLLLSQASSKLIPIEISQNSTPSMTFFSNYMEKHFYPRIILTIDHTFSTDVESLNPYTLENIDDNHIILKSAVDFQLLFFNMLYVLNSSNIYRPQMVEVILQVLNKFFDYYSNIFHSLLGSSDYEINRKITTVWLKNDTLKKYEKSILEGDNSVIEQESTELFKFCTEFYKKGKGIDQDSTLNTLNLDVVISFTNTLYWIHSWLPLMKKTIENTGGNDNLHIMNADELRSYWSFFEYTDIENSDKSLTLRILLNEENGKKFNDIVCEFDQLKLKLLSLLRFDIRAKSIHNIGKFFQDTSAWDLEVGNVELDQNIGTLISQLRTVENKLKQLPDGGKDRIFAGLDVVNNYAFISGASSINVVNDNGVKKILRNINILQHTSRNLYHEPSNISMSNAITFYTLVTSGGNVLLEKIQNKEFEFFTKKDIKNILRLQFSEEIQTQARRENSVSKNATNPINRRYNEALKKIDSLLK